MIGVVVLQVYVKGQHVCVCLRVNAKGNAIYKCVDMNAWSPIIRRSIYFLAVIDLLQLDDSSNA